MFPPIIAKKKLPDKGSFIREVICNLYLEADTTTYTKDVVILLFDIISQDLLV